MNLSPHFTFEELTASATATRLGLANVPDAPATANLQRLAVVLETARAVLGCALNLSSGYRCPPLNAAVGGAKTSAHMDGRAADFTPATGTLADAFAALASSTVPYDQLIIEHSASASWIHLGIARPDAIPRHEALNATGATSDTMTYTRVAAG